MGLDNYTDIIQYVLSRGDEIDAGGTASDSPFFGLMDEIIATVHRDLVVRHPWVDLVKDPPGVFITTASITRTITVAAAGLSVAATLSSSPSSASIAGRKINVSGKSWSARVTAHVGGETGVTLDAAPETVAAGTSCTIYQDEYDLASDLGVFVDGLWDQAGDFVPLVSYEALVAAYRDPPGAGRVADAFARITKRKIRLSHYPNSARRYEYPYVAEIADPSGSVTFDLPGYLRPVLAEGMLALLYQMKKDSRQAEAQQRFEIGIERAIVYESRRRTGLGLLSNRERQGGYGDRRRSA